MKSGKQRAAELKAKRDARAAKVAAAAKAVRDAVAATRRALHARMGVPVNRAALATHNSYGEPDYVTRGVYLDVPFTCVGCGAAGVWTATQQKWWYEVAKGDPFTTARRCRTCRRTERERKTQARRVHQDGLARTRGARPTE